MSEQELQELAADIKQNGLLEAITLTTDGLLLDGRCRRDACVIAGVEPHTTVYDGDDPISFVISKNRYRRHMSVSQKAIAVARLVTLKPGTNRFSRNQVAPFSEGNYSSKELAERSGIAVSTIDFGRAVLKDAEPHIVKMVENGEVNVKIAALAVRSVARTQQAGWTKEDVVRAGKAVVESFPSSQGKTLKKPTRQPAPRRPQAEPLPTYWPTKMTDEERGKPPRETWDEPDPDRPGLTRIQGYTAKHGHVHIMPLAVRQAQDNKIAARRLNSQIKEIVRPLKMVAEFMASDPPPIDLTTFVATLNAMAPEDVATTKRRLATTLAELPDLAGIDSLCGYLHRLRDLIAIQPVAEPKEACA